MPGYLFIFNKEIRRNRVFKNWFRKLSCSSSVQGALWWRWTQNWFLVLSLGWSCCKCPGEIQLHGPGVHYHGNDGKVSSRIAWLELSPSYLLISFFLCLVSSSLREGRGFLRQRNLVYRFPCVQIYIIYLYIIQTLVFHIGSSTLEEIISFVRCR